MDPSVVSLQQGVQTDERATFTTEMANVVETPAISRVHVTDVMGPTPGMIALPTPCGNQSRKGNGKETVTVEAQSRAPLPESEDHVWPLSTPINVQRLQDTLANHPDREFVSRLCNNLRYGADAGFTWRHTARCSRNLPTALSNLVLVRKTSPRRWPLGELQVLSPAPPTTALFSGVPHWLSSKEAFC